jgi:hypothetical protein
MIDKWAVLLFLQHVACVRFKGIDLFFHAVQLADLAEHPGHFAGFAFGLYFLDLDELASGMRPAARMGDPMRRSISA